MWYNEDKQEGSSSFSFLYIDDWMAETGSNGPVFRLSGKEYNYEEKSFELVEYDGAGIRY